jgi:RNA polymerase sigma-70 factor (ECF subfamily)
MADMAHLIEPAIPALRRYARTFVRDAGAADDLVQDTLERAISRWHQRRSDGDTRTWLFTILHNLAVNHLRRAARRGREVPLDDAGESDIAVPSTQEDALRRDDILGAVGQLPDDQRSVLLLVSLEDVSYAEAARILDIPIGTVMSRLARARARFLKLLEEPASERPHLRSVQ